MVWLTMIERGNSGMIDSFKYRETMTSFVFEGKVPEREESVEAKVEAAKDSIGKPAPDQALESAKALRERLLANKAKQQDL